MDVNADTADSSALTLSDIMGALAAEQVIPKICPVHGAQGNTLMYRRGTLSKAVFSCECVWDVPTRTWRHPGE
jgi:hypothetical protein